MVKPIVKDNKLFCRRCRKYFFSTKYMKTGKLVVQCHLCKRNDWNVVKPERKRKRK